MRVYETTVLEKSFFFSLSFFPLFPPFFSPKTSSRVVKGWSLNRNHERPLFFLPLFLGARPRANKVPAIFPLEMASLKKHSH